jgi:AraC-like DNA-binding protein
MLVDLKIPPQYDGLLYFAESNRNLPMIRSHHHVELELNVVVQGTVTYVMNGRRFTFAQKTLLWLFPRQEHQLVDRSDNARFLVAAFKPKLIAHSCNGAAYDALRQDPTDEGSILNTVLPPKPFELVQGILDSLLDGSLDADLLNREAGFGDASDFHFEHNDPDVLNAGLHYLLLLCWNSQVRGETHDKAVPLHPAVRRALKLLSDGDNEPQLDGLASACGTSKSYLSRMFRRQIGVPITRYRNSLRLARFFEEYREGEKTTLAEAVYAAGFGSYAQFYKVFTQAYGRGPRKALMIKPGAHS